MALAVALAECRSARRLASTWLFAALAVLAACSYTLFHAAIHMLSGASASFGWTSPRLLLPALGEAALWPFLLGAIFLARDMRSRDQRARLAEALAARPVTNPELLCGKWAALVAIAGLPLLGFLAVAQGFGAFASFAEWHLGEPFELRSVWLFLFVDALPAIVFWCALALLLAVALPGRWTAVAVGAALLGAQVWALDALPPVLRPALSTLASFGAAASDLVPSRVTAEALAQRLALLVLAAGLASAAAGLYPRGDAASRKGVALTAAGLLALGGIAVFLLAGSAGRDLEQRAAWLAAQQAAARSLAGVDVLSVSGNVDIDPGKRLTLDIQLEVDAHPAQPLTLRFNPGLAIERLTLNGSPLPHAHEDGLLTASLPAGTAMPSTLALTAFGRPDPRFAYLDAALEPRLLPGSALPMLGTEGGLFEAEYVALPTALDWLPRGQEPDFHALDLTVAAPSGWLVAGPGRRRAIAADSGESGRRERARFAFQPTAPAAGAGLFAARFERVAMEAHGVTAELLLHTRHRRNLRFFAHAAAVLEERIADAFGAAKEAGIPYPYEGLSVVETPAPLRTWGGGWRMESEQAQPGVLLLRERAFPTARFEQWFRMGVGTGRAVEGGDGARDPDAERKANILEGHVGSDFNGGNPRFGLARNLWALQTRASGPGAAALDFVLQHLVARRVHGSDAGYFSAHLHAAIATMGQLVGDLAGSILTGGGGISASWMNAPPAPAAWGRAQAVALADLETALPAEQAIELLVVKGTATADALYHGLGREATARLLAELRRRHAGGTFTARDFRAAAEAADADASAFLGDWLRDAGLPGFVASAARQTRLPDDAQGEPRYRAGLDIHNGEPTPGLLRLRYRPQGDDRFSNTDPIRIGGGESVAVGLVTSAPLAELWVAPYLSLNRDPFRLTVRPADERGADGDRFEGARPSAWRPAPLPGIVVDDLDAGFSIASAGEREDLRIGGQGASDARGDDLDEGLPVLPLGPPVPGVWYRQALLDGWGRYRHTAARVAPSAGRHVAVFAAQLPAAGGWRLHYHLPALEPAPSSGVGQMMVRISAGERGDRLGGFEMTLLADGARQSAAFDASDATPGWHDLGVFQLPAGEARLEISDASDGAVVIADAIRWERAD